MTGRSIHWWVWELDHDAIAAEIGETTEFRCATSRSIADFAASLTTQSRTDFFGQHGSNVAQDYRDGLFADENNQVEVITGHRATTVPEFVNANRARFEQHEPLALHAELLQ